MARAPQELTQNSAGNTLTLTGANTYSGPTTITAGTLAGGALNTFSNASAMIVQQGGTLDLGGYNQAVSSLSDGGGIGGTVTNNGSNPATLTIQGGGSTSYLYSGVILDGASKTGLAVTSGSRLYLEGANTYTGGTFVDSGGYLVVDGSASITGPVTVTNTGSLFFFVYGATKTFDGTLSGSGTVAAQGNGTLILTGANTNSQINVDGPATLQIGAGGTTGSFTGNVGDAGAVVFDRSDNYAYGGVVSAGGSLTQAGLGVLTLSGANSYGGATTVQSGTLKAGATNAFSAQSATTVDSGATLDLGGFDQTVSSLAGAGTVTNGGASPAVLTNQGASSTFSGVIQDGASAIGLTQNSAGNTLTLAGANTYSGPTTVAAGTLKGAATFAFSQFSAMTVNAGATLDLGGFNQGVFSLSGGGTVTNNGPGPGTLVVSSLGTSSTFSGSIRDGTSTIGLTLEGLPGTLTLTGSNTYTGPTEIGSYTLKGGAPNTFSAASPTFVGGTLDLGGFTQTINNVTLGGTIQNGSLIGAIVDGGFGIVSGIGGPASLTTTGTVDMENGNSFTGPTVINSGGIAIGLTANAFSPNSPMTVNAGGTLRLTLGFDQTVASLSGDGLVTNHWPIPVTLTNVGASSTFSGLIQDTVGTIGLTQDSTVGGALTLSGANTYSGPTTVAAGTLKAGAANALSAASATTVDAGGALDLGGFSQTVSSLAGAGTVTNSGTSDAVLTNVGPSSTFSGSITDGATRTTGLTENSAGNTLTLSGTNTYSGPTTVEAGSSIAATGRLNLTASNFAAAAIVLQGDGASILATGGGTIAAAGDAIEFLGGTNQTATFDSFDISTQSGDIVFADPSNTTITFNNSTVNARDRLPPRRDGRQHRKFQRQRLDPDRRDGHRRCVDVQRQPHQWDRLEPDRTLEREQPGGHEQRRRLRAAGCGEVSRR